MNNLQSFPIDILLAIAGKSNTSLFQTTHCVGLVDSLGKG